MYRITIENYSGLGENREVVIKEVPDKDMTLRTIISDLVIPALRAMGCTESEICHLFNNAAD